MQIPLCVVRLCASACILLVAATTGGCINNINHLRDAQDTFNQTTTLENKYRFDPKSVSSDKAAFESSVQQPMAIEAGYTAVIVSLDKLGADTDTVKSLRGDKLYGNALVLKAMAYWRLHKFDQAKAAASAAQVEGLEPGSRDNAFVVALPGLIKNDQAYAKLYGPQPAGAPTTNDARLKDIAALIDSAEQDLDEAQRTLPDGHPMGLYLSLSGMASLKNLSDACKLLSSGSAASGTCYEDRKIDCRAQRHAAKALALGADMSTVKLVGEGTLMREPALTAPTCN